MLRVYVRWARVRVCVCYSWPRCPPSTSAKEGRRTTLPSPRALGACGRFSSSCCHAALLWVVGREAGAPACPLDDAAHCRAAPAALLMPRFRPPPPPPPPFSAAPPPPGANPAADVLHQQRFPV
jgi:hypothetical protein